MRDVQSREVSTVHDDSNHAADIPVSGVSVLRTRRVRSAPEQTPRPVRWAGADSSARALRLVEQAASGADGLDLPAPGEAGAHQAWRKFLDATRAEASRRRREERVEAEPAPGPGQEADDSLRLYLLCAHPSLTPASAGDDLALFHALFARTDRQRSPRISSV